MWYDGRDHFVIHGQYRVQRWLGWRSKHYCTCQQGWWRLRSSCRDPTNFFIHWYQAFITDSYVILLFVFLLTSLSDFLDHRVWIPKWTIWSFTPHRPTRISSRLSTVSLWNPPSWLSITTWRTWLSALWKPDPCSSFCCCDLCCAKWSMWSRWPAPRKDSFKSLFFRSSTLWYGFCCPWWRQTRDGWHGDCACPPFFLFQLPMALVFEGPVSRLEKDRDWTGPRLEKTRTRQDQDQKRPVWTGRLLPPINTFNLSLYPSRLVEVWQCYGQNYKISDKGSRCDGNKSYLTQFFTVFNVTGLILKVICQSTIPTDK